MKTHARRWSAPRGVELRRALATFWAAWELDPGLVVFEIAQWRERHGRFLALVEPNIDGLSRVVAACERTYRFKNVLAPTLTAGFTSPAASLGPGHCYRVVGRRDRQLRLLVDDDMDEQLIDQGLYIKDSDER